VFYGGGGDFFTRRNLRNLGPVSWWHNRELRADDTGYTEDLIVDRACAFLRANSGRPFFCYVPFHLVHEPLQAKNEDLAAVDPAIVDPAGRAYAAMLHALDANVARLLATLDEAGLRDNTIVVFTSDNGAAPWGSNQPLRGGKHSLYDGGVRVPTVIRWPAGGLGGCSWNGLCSSLDMLPTLAALTGVRIPPGLTLDGKDLSTALQTGGSSPVESVYWAWHGTDALRTRQWKLHRFADRVELYEMEADPAEAVNVAAAHADVVDALIARMDDWAASLAVALSHKPPRIDGAPGPDGEVLEITVTATPESKTGDLLVVPFTTFEGAIVATDHLVWDVTTTPGSLESGFFISPLEYTRDTVSPAFRKGDGIDQFGREQAAGPEMRGGPGAWEHRVVGLSSVAPNTQLGLAGVFRGGRPGTYRIRVDNVGLRHVDGSIVPVWTGAAQTQPRPVKDTAGFKDVRVRAVR
jgi:hypothetical protein